MYPQPSWLPVVQRRRSCCVTPAYSGDAVPVAVRSCLAIGVVPERSAASAWRSAPRRPTRRRRGCPASSPRGCRRWRGRIAGALAAFTAILTAADAGLHRRRQLRPVAAADRARPALSSAGCSRLPMALARRRRPRHPRAAAAVELPDAGPGRGGAVRDHPGGAARCSAAGRPRRGEGHVGGGAGACARCRSGSLGCAACVRSARSSALVALAAFVVLPSLITNANSVKLTGIIGFVDRRPVGRCHHRSRRPAVARPVRDRRGRRRRLVRGVEPHRELPARVPAAPASPRPSCQRRHRPARAADQGLMLTVTTLGFALVMPVWHAAAAVDARRRARIPGRPIVFGHAARHRPRVLLRRAGHAARWRCSSPGTSGAVASAAACSRVRDNEDNGTRVHRPRVAGEAPGFALAGFIAGIGGAMYGHSLSHDQRRTASRRQPASTWSS